MDTQIENIATVRLTFSLMEEILIIQEILQPTSAIDAAGCHELRRAYSRVPTLALRIAL